MCICGHSVTSHDFLGCNECGCKRFRSIKRLHVDSDEVGMALFWVAVCVIGGVYVWFAMGVLGWIH